MKVYVATRFYKRESIQKLLQMLRLKGHQITCDWTKHASIKPYNEHSQLAKHYAFEDIEGVRTCDMFILISDEGGKGMYVELGVAITLNLTTGKPLIYVVGEWDSNCIFYFHPSVTRGLSIAEVLKAISTQQK